MTLTIKTTGTMEPELTAVLVDDEEHCTDMLAWMLARYCPNVQAIGTFNESGESIAVILVQ
ncbi:MAG: hypothetical protein IPH05_18915 [Flavobacteriales bacterium]|nr:hypothetical protein [Flavobacteriales bacterium]